MKPPHTGMPLDAYAPTRKVGRGMNCSPPLADSFLGVEALVGSVAWAPSAAAGASEWREQPDAQAPNAAVRRAMPAPRRIPTPFALLMSQCLLDARHCRFRLARRWSDPGTAAATFALLYSPAPRGSSAACAGGGAFANARRYLDAG